MRTLCVLGRQPALGLAELESLYGADKLRPVGSQAVVVDVEPTSIDFSRLGGTVKFCKILTQLNTTNWSDIYEFLAGAIPRYATALPKGKMRLGFSVFDLNTSLKQINASALALKKIIRASGRSVRVVPNVQPALNSAQVLHNQLTGPLGWELIFIRDANQTIVAQNIAEQDIESYAKRDQNRPKRDARIGMLPPKLAQIIINLAVGPVGHADPACEPGKYQAKTVLDPFCGSGVILQEALLMGYDVVGGDNDRRMVEYANINLKWLLKDRRVGGQYKIELADATKALWATSPDIVACETYLGRPFSMEPPAAVLQEVIQDVNTIHKKFLRNLANQTKPGFRMCLATAAWRTKNGFKRLPILDQLEELGYNRVSFVHSSSDDLIYHRESQIVARELVILTRK